MLTKRPRRWCKIYGDTPRISHSPSSNGRRYRYWSGLEKTTSHSVGSTSGICELSLWPAIVSLELVQSYTTTRGSSHSRYQTMRMDVGCVLCCFCWRVGADGESIRRNPYATFGAIFSISPRTRTFEVQDVPKEERGKRGGGEEARREGRKRTEIAHKLPRKEHSGGLLVDDGWSKKVGR